MSNIRVSFAEIEQSAAVLNQGREEISSRLHAMQQHIHQLLSSGFVTDQASVKFGEAYQQYTTSADAVVSRLNEIQAFLQQASQAMREMDQQLAARIH